MFRSKRQRITDLPDKEWNFSEILEEDTEACLRYELAREVEHHDAYFSVFSSREQAPFALEPMAVAAWEHREASEDFKQVRAKMYVRLFDAPAVRQETLGREVLPGLYFLYPDGSMRGYPPDLSEKPWLALDESWQSNLQIYTEQFLTGITFHTPGESQNWEAQHPGLIQELSRSGRWQMLTVKVDWNKGDSALVEGFTAWLRKQRPKGFPSTSLTGRQSAVDSLNALSALRLRHYLSIEEAAKHTKAVTGKSLYNDRSSWDRAQRRASQLFIRTFSQAGPPKSESRASNRKSQD